MLGLAWMYDRRVELLASDMAQRFRDHMASYGLAFPRAADHWRACGCRF